MVAKKNGSKTRRWKASNGIEETKKSLDDLNAKVRELDDVVNDSEVFIAAVGKQISVD